MTSFIDTRAYKKGSLGEKFCDENFSEKFIPYGPLINNTAHCFDRFFISKCKKIIFINEVKTKEHRDNFPDTGFNLKNYKEYLYIYEKYNINFHICWVDIKRKYNNWQGWIYGNWLSELKKEIIISDKRLIYPRIEPLPPKIGRIIYFPIDFMKHYFKITEEQKRIIAINTNKNTKYENGYINKLIHNKNSEEILKKIKKINTSSNRGKLIKESTKLFNE